MWEIELRAPVGPVRVLLWRTTDEEVTALVVAGLKERLKRATCARSRSVLRGSRPRNWHSYANAVQG